jgi:hypothetical protein
MARTTFRLRRSAMVGGAALLLSGVVGVPAALASEGPPVNQAATHVETPPVGAAVLLGSATCFGRTVTLRVPSGGADFYGSSDPAVVDVILGTSGEDHIFAQAGNDFVCGGGGWDSIDGGEGDDWIDGEADTDSLYGGPGNDVIYGGGSWDLIIGDEGNDILFGEKGDDELYCDVPGSTTGAGRSDVADGGPGASDSSFSKDCESMVNIEYS